MNVGWGAPPAPAVASWPCSKDSGDGGPDLFQHTSIDFFRRLSCLGARICRHNTAAPPPLPHFGTPPLPKFEEKTSRLWWLRQCRSTSALHQAHPYCCVATCLPSSLITYFGSRRTLTMSPIEAVLFFFKKTKKCGCTTLPSPPPPPSN